MQSGQEPPELSPEALREVARLQRRRIIVAAVSIVLAVTIVLIALNLITRNTNLRYLNMSVTEIQTLTAEQIEGLEGFIEIAEVTHNNSAGHVFDEEPRDALRARTQASREFLATFEAEQAATPSPNKEQARTRLESAEQEVRELFQAIRDVQAAVDQWDDAH